MLICVPEARERRLSCCRSFSENLERCTAYLAVSVRLRITVYSLSRAWLVSVADVSYQAYLVRIEIDSRELNSSLEADSLEP